jgi:hypothetical protein
MFKKRKKDFLDKFKPIIDEHKKDLPIFEIDKEYKFINYNTDSWFDINKYKMKIKTEPQIITTDELTECKYKTIKVKMDLNDIHKKILNNWFTACTMIYNKTLEFIRSNYQFTKKDIFRDILIDEINNDENFYNKYYIRDQMNLIKKQVQNQFKFTIDKKDTKNKTKNVDCAIDIHTMDKTIFQLVQNIKSCKTNMLRGHIKRFRLKFWKYNRPSQTIELEKCKIQDGILCKSIFKHLDDIKYYYNNLEYNISNITTDFKINYNSILNEYYLYISVPITKESIEDRKELIILDPGLRTYMTGLSNYEHINICPDINKIIKKDISKLNKIKNNILIPKRINSLAISKWLVLSSIFSFGVFKK